MEQHKDTSTTRPGSTGRNYDLDFFRDITTEEQAYWLGFIRADGYLSPSKNTVGVTLAVEDKAHLAKLARAVGLGESAIRIYKRQPGNWQVQDSARLLFCRKRFYESFVALGYTNCKADYADFPPIPANLLRHFIRGMFDGDGCAGLSLYEGKFKTIARFRFSISVANELMANRLCDTLREATGEHVGISNDHSIWAVRATNQTVLRSLYHYLYDGATVFLERKRMKIEAAIQYSPDNNTKPAAYTPGLQVPVCV